MTNEEILREINFLPPDAQRQVADFVVFLRERYKSSQPAETAATSNLTSEEFIGMWRDREDMQNGTLKHKRVLGLQRGQVWTSDDFDDPLPDGFWLGEDNDEVTVANEPAR